MPRGTVGRAISVGVGVDRSAAVDHEPLDHVDQPRVVDSLELLVRGHRRHPPLPPQPVHRRERGFDRQDPLGRVGVLVDVPARS